MKIITAVCWGVTALLLILLVIGFATGVLQDLFSGFVLDFSGEYTLAGEYSADPHEVRSLEISWSAGRVEVTAYEGDEIYIAEYTRRALRDDEGVQIAVSNGTLRIAAFGKKVRINAPPKRLEVRIPAGIIEEFENVTVKGSSGNVLIENIAALTLHTDLSSGDTTLLNVESQIIRHGSSSGEFTARGSAADEMTITTSSGDISVEDSAIGSLRGDTSSGTQFYEGRVSAADLGSSSGNIRLKCPEPPEHVRADTSSGSITLTLPHGDPLSYWHSTSSGRFTSEIAVYNDKDNPRLSFKTSSGDVKIKESDN